MTPMEDVWSALQELGAALWSVEKLGDPPEWVQELRKAVDAAQEPASDAAGYDAFVREGGV